MGNLKGGHSFEGRLMYRIKGKNLEYSVKFVIISYYVKFATISYVLHGENEKVHLTLLDAQLLKQALS